MKLSFHKYALSLLASLVLVSCAKDYALVGTEREKGREPIWLSTSVMVHNTRAAGAVSNDPISSTTDDWESRIVSLRMIISDSKTGIIVYNEKEDNPQELTERYTQYNSPDARWRRPIKIVPGTYDFWFIANEGKFWYSPTETNGNKRDDYSWNGTKVLDKLTVGSNIARIFDGRVYEDDAARRDWEPLSHLDAAPYRKWNSRTRRWVPEVDPKPGNIEYNYPMPMSAVYKDIEINITRNNKGASQDDPQHFVAGGDEKVKLVRCMAKVTINVENAAHVNGDKRVDYLQWPALGKFAITLLNRPRYWSFFNTPLFDMNHTPREFKFYSDIFPDQSRYRCTTICEGETAAESYGGIVYDSPSSGATDLKRYRYTFYVPELLLPKHPLDGDPSRGEQAFDRLNALMLAFSAPNKGFWKKSSDALFDNYPEATESRHFYPYASKAEFEAKLDETKAFNLGTADLTERNDNTDNLRLPNPDWYSKFSLLRNRHYVYTIREQDRMVVDVRIAPWETNAEEGEVHSFDEFQVEVLDPSFSNATKKTKLRFQTTFGKNSQGYDRHLFAKVKFTLLNQNGAVNQQAYFSNLGNVQQVQAESGNKPKWVAFGNWQDVHFDGGFGECEINWGETSGINQPASGKNILKVEFFADPEMTRLVKDTSPLYISVRDVNWKDEFRKLK